MRSRGIFREISVTVRPGVGVLNAVWDDEWISVPMEDLHLKQILFLSQINGEKFAAPPVV